MEPAAIKSMLILLTLLSKPDLVMISFFSMR
jgi:hypothetical protein